MKEVLFRHCREAELEAISGPDRFRSRHEGGTRQAEAAYTALLGVITEMGLQKEYEQYRKGDKDAKQITGNLHAH